MVHKVETCHFQAAKSATRRGPSLLGGTRIGMAWHDQEASKSKRALTIGGKSSKRAKLSCRSQVAKNRWMEMNITLASVAYSCRGVTTRISAQKLQESQSMQVTSLSSFGYPSLIYCKKLFAVDHEGTRKIEGKAGALLVPSR